MAKSPCIKVIVDAAKTRGQDISDAKAALILSKINNFAKELARVKYGGSLEAGAREAAGRYLDDLAFTKACIVRDELLYIRAQRKITRSAEKFLAAGGLYAKGMEAFINGTGKKIQGAGLHMDAVAHNRWNRLLGYYTSKLDPRLTSIDASGALEKNIWNELWAMSGGHVSDPTLLGNADAKAIATARMDTMRQAHSMLHAAGDINRQRAGWAVPQTWSLDRLLDISKNADGKYDANFGFDKWKAAVLPHIDALETFKGEPPDKWLRSFWDNIYTDNYTSGSRANKAKDSNVGMLSRGRKMFFKTGEGAYEVNAMFGENASREGFLTYAKNAAEHSARLEFLGARPTQVWNEVRNALIEKAKNDKLPDVRKQVAALEGESLRIAFDIASGESDNPGNVKIAKTLANVQAGLVLASQGATIVSAVAGDTVTMHMQATRFGFSAMDVYARALVELFTPENGDTTNFLKHMGIGNEMAQGVNHTRMQQHERGGKLALTATELLFKANGVSWWTKNTRKAVAGSLLSQLGDLASKDFSQLGERHRALMDKYDIDANMWEALRNTKGNVGDLGAILTGSITGEVNTATIQALKSRYGAKWENVVEERLSFLISGEVHNAIIEAGARERKWTTLGTRSGTFSGTAVRMLMFMKSFPIAMVTRQLAEEVAHGNKLRFLEYMAASTMMGYLSILVKDTLAGKKPRPFTDQDDKIQWSILKDSLQRGGFLGVFGDMALQEYDRGFRDFSSYIAGPLVGKVFDPVLAGANKAVRGENFRGEISDLGGLIPFNNLIWSKAILDQTLGAKLKEAINPGVHRKLRESASKNYNQDYRDWSAAHRY